MMAMNTSIWAKYDGLINAFKPAVPGSNLSYYFRVQAPIEMHVL